MFQKLERISDRFRELTEELAQPDTVLNVDRYRRCLKEHAALLPTVETYEHYLSVLRSLEEAELLLSDPEMAEMANEELHALSAEKKELEEKLKMLLIPPDPMDERNVYLELRAGAGGEEAALFAGDLLRMYNKYADAHALSFRIMSLSDSDLGGVNDAMVYISGAEPWRLFKYERGVHSVKRVPVTESSGRIHTSTVTVAVLPEAEDVEVTIDPADIRVDVYRSSGKGGQGVNTTDSAVRMTHLPTGIVVTCQDERSQLENKAKALKALRSRILDKVNEEKEQKLIHERRDQIGSGDRSEKIRTYYFNHDYVTDHRIGLTVNRVDNVMNGGLDPFLDALLLAEKTRKLQTLGQNN